MLKLIKEELEDEVIITEEPTNVLEEEPKQELTELEEMSMNQSLLDNVNDLINSCWTFIDAANSILISYEEFKKDNWEEISNIINSLINDTTINVGMLNKVVSLISDERTDLLKQGEEKAENLIEN